MSRKVQDYKILYLRDRVCALGPSQFVDIGANYGEFTQAMRHDVLKVWSIEPNPVVFLALVESFRGVQNVELIEAGITATAGQSVFHFNLFYSGGGGLAVGKNVINSRGQFSTLVNCLSPQELMNRVLETDGSIVIKIDVEGHDFVILSHLFLSLINCRRGFLIMVEYIPESHIGSGDLVRDVLQRYYSEGCSIGVLMDRHEVKILESLNDLDSLGVCEILIEMAIPAKNSP